MKKADIKLGVVYAYQRGEWDTPAPVVFLGMDLYRGNSGRSAPGSPWCRPAPDYDSRPKQASGFSGYDVGYPAVTVRRFIPAAVPLAAMRSLDASLIGQPLSQDLRDAGLETTLITRLAGITGVYAEVVDAREDQRRADQEAAARQAAADARRAARETAIISRFSALGLTVSRDWRVPDVLTVTLRDAELIADRLEG